MQHPVHGVHREQLANHAEDAMRHRQPTHRLGERRIEGDAGCARLEERKGDQNMQGEEQKRVNPPEGSDRVKPCAPLDVPLARW